MTTFVDTNIRCNTTAKITMYNHYKYSQTKTVTYMQQELKNLENVAYIRMVRMTRKGMCKKLTIIKC